MTRNATSSPRAMIGANLLPEEFAALIVKSDAATTIEAALAATRKDCEEWPEVLEADGRINLLRYAARLHQSTK